jgi:CubicO group peptidase (beta-lactamase class C family)
MKFFLCLLLTFTTNPQTVHAQSQARLTKIISAWEDWAREGNVTSSNIAVAYRGKILAQETKGSNVRAAMPLASLSKAVSGACISALIKEHAIKTNTEIGVLFGPALEELGLNNSVAAKITVEQLLTHTSGLEPDSTQRDYGSLASGKPKHLLVSKKALKRQSKKSNKKYFYNNENYAVLGLIIETLSGTSYMNYCSEKVLRPFGVTSTQLDKDYPGMVAWGGLAMTPSDYLRFTWGNFGPRSYIGKKPNSWPNVTFKGGRRYGVGLNYRPSGKSYNFWTFGRHCHSLKKAGAFFASWGGEWSVAVNYNQCPKNGLDRKLDQALSNAALR